jgi:hypothetical protein
MQMLTTASKLDFQGWVRGVLGAFISGGAGSISAGFAANIADPAHDISIFKVMWITFLFSGIISLAKFLQTSPVPEPPKP